MKRIFFIILATSWLLSSCGQYTDVLKLTDVEYKYEAAKEYFVKGKYDRVVLLLGDLVTLMKGTVRGEECLYMLAMAEFYDGNYDISHTYFKKYYQTYQKGKYVEEARFYCALSLYESIPDARLDQSNTLLAIREFQDFLDYYPFTSHKSKTQDLIYLLQDKLVEKELIAAQLYYDLGSYMGNCAYGGSNYEACIVTSQNALLDFPYASPSRREEFAILILRSKYHLALQSIEEKRLERFRDAVDEYYGFANEYPESDYLKEAKKILEHSNKAIAQKGNITEITN